MHSKRTAFGIVIFLSFLTLSCSTSRRTALSCSDFPVYKTYNKNRSKIFTGNQKSSGIFHPIIFSKKNPRKKRYTVNNYPSGVISINGQIENLTHLNNTEYSKGLIASVESTIVPLKIRFIESRQIGSASIPVCDSIILRTGAIILGKIQEIGQNKIKYRKCDNLNGRVKSVSKSDVAAIYYANGSSEIIISSNPGVYDNENEISTSRQAARLGFIGFLVSLAGLFVARIPLGVLAIVLGSVSLNRMKQNHNRYIGTALAIAGIVIGSIDVVGAILLLAGLKF